MLIGNSSKLGAGKVWEDASQKNLPKRIKIQEFNLNRIAGIIFAHTTFV